MRPIRNDQPPTAWSWEPDGGTPVPQSDANKLDLKAVARDVRVRPRRISSDGSDDLVPVLLGGDRDKSKPVVARDDPPGADVDGERLPDTGCGVSKRD